MLRPRGIARCEEGHGPGDSPNWRTALVDWRFLVAATGMRGRASAGADRSGCGRRRRSMPFVAATLIRGSVDRSAWGADNRGTAGRKSVASRHHGAADAGGAIGGGVWNEPLSNLPLPNLRARIGVRGGDSDSNEGDGDGQTIEGRHGSVPFEFTNPGGFSWFPKNSMRGTVRSFEFERKILEWDVPELRIVRKRQVGTFSWNPEARSSQAMKRKGSRF